jgi:hypothetical protein
MQFVPCCGDASSHVKSPPEIGKGLSFRVLVLLLPIDHPFQLVAQHFADRRSLFGRQDLGLQDQVFFKADRDVLFHRALLPAMGARRLRVTPNIRGYNRNSFIWSSRRTLGKNG